MCLTRAGFEEEYLNGILNGYDSIDKTHPVWKLCKPNPRANTVPTRLEFEKFIGTKSMENLREDLLKDLGKKETKNTQLSHFSLFNEKAGNKRVTIQFNGYILPYFYRFHYI